MKHEMHRGNLLTETEREMLDEGTLDDAEQLARWLAGEDLGYSREQIKGWRIAAMLRVLLRIIRRLVAAKSAARVRALEKTIRELRAAAARVEEGARG